jgi:hypothetical protein
MLPSIPPGPSRLRCIRKVSFEEELIKPDWFSAFPDSQDVAVLILRYPNMPIETVFAFGLMAFFKPRHEIYGGYEENRILCGTT